MCQIKTKRFCVSITQFNQILMLQEVKGNLVTHHKQTGGGGGGGGGVQGTASFSDSIHSLKRSLLGSRIPVRERVWPRTSPGR